MDTKLQLHHYLLLLISALGPSGHVNSELVRHLTKKNTPLHLVSEGYPAYTSDPLTWKLLVPEGSGVHIECADFAVPKGPDCHSTLMIRKGKWYYTTLELCDTNDINLKSNDDVSLNIHSRDSSVRFNCTVRLNLSSIRSFDTEKTSSECGLQTKYLSLHVYNFIVHLRSQEHGIFCTGTIITRRHILTSAHCVADKAAADIEVLVIAIGDSGDCPTFVNQTISVQNITIHEDYKPDNKLNDISVLKLAKCINSFREDVGPVCLPSEDIFYSLMTIGPREPKYPIRIYSLDCLSIPMEAHLVGVDFQSCSLAYNGDDRLLVEKGKHLCAIATDRDKPQCATDGPLLSWNPYSKKYIQVGITAYGDECVTGKPTVFTDLQAYLDWIETIISDGRAKKQGAGKKKHWWQRVLP